MSFEPDLQVVADHEAPPFIMFKANSTSRNPHHSAIWNRAFHFYSFNQQRFMECCLREKIAELEAKYAATETANAILKDDLRKAKAENAQLKKQVEKLTHHDDLNDIELDLLERIANVDHAHCVASVLQLNFFPLSLWLALSTISKGLTSLTTQEAAFPINSVRITVLLKRVESFS